MLQRKISINKTFIAINIIEKFPLANSTTKLITKILIKRNIALCFMLKTVEIGKLSFSLSAIP